jgi:hypothetical protein
LEMGELPSFQKSRFSAGRNHRLKATLHRAIIKYPFRGILWVLTRRRPWGP